MSIETFDVTDANGKRVQGTVEVFRKPGGAYFDPNDPYYRNPRYADAHFEFLNTREACTIDRSVLESAMREAFSDALVKFGIDGPDQSKVAEDVKNSIDVTRKQCARNADKYVSNETFSSTDWGSGEAVGHLVARAYAAVPDASGGLQTVVAREGSWPADDISDLRSDTAGVRFLSRRDIARDGSGSFGGEGLGPGALSATQLVPPPKAENCGSKPMRYLARRIAGQASAFETGVPEAPLKPSDEVRSGYQEGSFVDSSEGRLLGQNAAR
jgi:hypothetical protein